jgi:hypothetical protein
MKYQVGDEIIVLHNKEEGRVVEVLNDKMVLIEVRGVQFPAYTDQIDFPYFHRFTKNKLVQSKEAAKPKVYIEDVKKEKVISKLKQSTKNEGFWLSLIPKFVLDDFNDEIVESFKIYLINKNNEGYNFIYKQQFGGATDFELKNDVPAFADFYLHDITFESFNDSPTFAIEFSLAQPDKYKAEYYEASLKIKAKQLFQQIETMKEKNEPTLTYKLFDEYPFKEIKPEVDLSKLANKGFKIYDAGKAKQHIDPARSVVDLHIEKLANDWKQLSNLEILAIQLKEFEKWYDLAVLNHQPQLIVIHGVGTGKLRDEIHDLLKIKREVSYFINQYHPSFGYGATEIFFKK